MPGNICWIRSDTNPNTFLTPEMKKSICREDGTLHRLYQSLVAWPIPMLSADQFYRAILHSDNSPLGLHKSEFVATYVAILAKCTYARAHHGENFLTTACSRDEGTAMLNALERDDLEAHVLDPEMRAMARYTKKLSLEPSEMCELDITDLRDAGLSEAQIVQVNQIAASFGYWVRMINGLGISLGNETIGMTATSLDKIVKNQLEHSS